MKTVQKFTDEYLEYCRTLTPEQIMDFLEAFQQLQADIKPDKSQLISIKIPKSLLTTFKMKAKAKGTPYQTQIKELMKRWVLE